MLTYVLIPGQTQFRVERVEKWKSMVFAKNYEATARNEGEACHTSSVKSRASS